MNKRQHDARNSKRYGNFPVSCTARQSIFLLFLKIAAVELFFWGARFLVRITESYVVMPEEFFVTLRIFRLAISFYIILYWIFYYYRVSPEKILFHRGVLFRGENIFALKNVEVIRLQQSIFGKIFGYGDIILSAPTMSHNIHMKNIQSPRRKIHLIEMLIPKTSKENINNEDMVVLSS